MEGGDLAVFLGQKIVKRDAGLIVVSGRHSFFTYLLYSIVKFCIGRRQTELV